MRAYSKDLRDRIIKDVKDGGTYEEVGKKYNVSRSAIGRWYLRYKEEGNYEAKKNLGAKRKIDLTLLKEYVEANKDMKLKEASEYLKVSIYAVSYWLKKIGYSYKKKPLAIWKRTRKEEENI